MSLRSPFTWLVIGVGAPLGAVVGFWIGWYWTVAAMFAVGGGHAHNDLFDAYLGATVGRGVWAIGLPSLVFFARRLVRLRQGPQRSEVVTALLFAAAFVAASFVATALLYYADAIATLTPEMGGPKTSIPPAVRQWSSSIGAAGTAALAAWCFIRARAKARQT